MTKLTKILFFFTVLFLVISIVVGWYGAAHWPGEEFGVLYTVYPGFIFVILTVVLIINISFYDKAAQERLLLKPRKRFHSSTALILLALTLVLLVWISVR
jgi:hypothetical protein